MDNRASSVTRMSNLSQHECMIQEIRRRAPNRSSKRQIVLATLSEKNPEKSWAATGAVESGVNLRCICSAVIGPDGSEQGWLGRLLSGFYNTPINSRAFYIKNKNNGKQLWVGAQCLMKIGDEEDKREAKALIKSLKYKLCPSCWKPEHGPCGPRLKDPLYINGRCCIYCRRRVLPPKGYELSCVPCTNKYGTLI